MSVWEILGLIGIDLLLSGDNAVVIALAASRVPKHLQKRVIFLGMFGAILLRIIAATVIIRFLEFPFVQAVGGIILFRISYHLMVQKEEEPGEIKAKDSIWGAIQIIAISDLAMSIDNVIALTSVAEGIMPVILGILISIPIIILGSKFLIALMEKYPIIIYVGAGFLAFAAGKMILEDKGLTFITNEIPSALHLWIPIIMALVLVLIGFLRNNLKRISYHVK